MALWSCINQLHTQRPDEQLSLPWVHLAYQHFRSRLQNLSRILTIYPQILQVLLCNMTESTRNDRLDRNELVWPLVGTVCAQSRGLAFLEQVGAGAGVLPGAGKPRSCVLPARSLPRAGAPGEHRRQEHPLLKLPMSQEEGR